MLCSWPSRAASLPGAPSTLRLRIAGRIQALVAALPSPGWPPVAGLEERRLFWAAIAAGVSSEDAAASAGVPQAVGARWFRKAGGMAPAMFMALAEPLSGRCLSCAEREEIALMRAQGHSMQEVARRLRRAASTISRGCGETRPPAAVARSIARRRRSDRHAGPGLQSLRSIRPCALMCRSLWPAWSSLRAAPP